MKKPLLFASLLLIFASCNNDATVANHVLMPLTETVEVDNLSDHIKEIEVVPIQESDAPLFMGVSKAVLDNNNNLHIVDYAGSLISIGNDGTLLPKTINRGRANNEYVAISDLAVSNSEELMLMESAQIKFFNIEDGSLSLE